MNITTRSQCSKYHLKQVARHDHMTWRGIPNGIPFPCELESRIFLLCGTATRPRGQVTEFLSHELIASPSDFSPSLLPVRPAMVSCVWSRFCFFFKHDSNIFSNEARVEVEDTLFPSLFPLCTHLKSFKNFLSTNKSSRRGATLLPQIPRRHINL